MSGGPGHVFTRPLAYRLFFAKNLPLALFAGLNLEALTRNTAIVSIRYGWRNTNPFGSMVSVLRGARGNAIAAHKPPQ